MGKALDTSSVQTSTSMPNPVELTWRGRALGRSEVARIYLLGSALILGLGITLNYVLTDGAWYAPGNTPYSNQYLQNHPYDILSGTLLVVSLVLLGWGFFSRARSRHLVRAAGFGLFGFYWGSQAMRLYASEEGDFVNALFAMFGVFFFNYFAYHELVSYRRHEDPRALAWLTGTAFITTGVYFLTHKIQPVSQWLILRVSEQTEWLLHAFGQDVVRDGGFPEGSLIYYPDQFGGGFFPIQIILACTAIQSIMIFAGGILALRPPRLGEGVSGKASQFEKLKPTYTSRRVWALLLTVPLIYVLNLFRNVIIIWMSGQEEAVLFSTNDAAFWFAHNVIGKGGSLVAMIIIAFIVFQILPELYDSIIGLLDLKERRGPLESWFAQRWGRRPGNGGARKPATEPRPSTPVTPSPEPRLE